MEKLQRVLQQVALLQHAYEGKGKVTIEEFIYKLLHIVDPAG
jgi:hypothetical protein